MSEALKLPTLALAGIEAALNRCLLLDPSVAPRLAAVAGKVIAVELRGLNLVFYLAPGPGGIQLLSDFEGAPHATLRGTPLSMARLGLGGGQRGPLLAGDVEILGDLELGQTMEDVLREVNIDWEEQLSRIVGDVTAHQVGNFVRGVLSWGKQAADSLGQDVAEYLQEETRALPERREVEEFLALVDRLRADSDRLAARVQRLRNTLAARAQN